MTSIIFKNRYYALATKNSEYIPYTYLIKHNRSGKVYYGAKYSKDANPKYFFEYYFTSSKIISEILKMEGIEAFSWEIRKTFNTKEECISWEKKVLRRMKVASNESFLNIDENQKPHDNSNTKFISNPSTGKCIRIKKSADTPTGWVDGNINQNRVKPEPRVWMHDPETNKAYHINPMQVMSWMVPGRGKAYKSNSETMRKKNSIWVTDGEENKMIDGDATIPEGWSRGMTKSEEEKTKTNDTNSKLFAGTKFITNGVDVVRIHEPTVLPEGWRYGSLELNPTISDIRVVSNGIHNSKIKEEHVKNLPVGYWVGRTKHSVRPNAKNSVKITNGMFTLFHAKHINIPDGWVVV